MDRIKPEVAMGTHVCYYMANRCDSCSLADRSTQAAYPDRALISFAVIQDSENGVELNLCYQCTVELMSRIADQFASVMESLDKEDGPDVHGYDRSSR